MERAINDPDPDAPAFRVVVILAPGRSGTMLVRNELLKPAAVTCLSSDGAAAWFETNRDLLCGGDRGALARAHPALARQWTERHFDREDLKQQFALAPTPSLLTRLLLVKFAMMRFAGRAPGLFAHVDVIHLCRDPLAVVASMCRPLAWNEGQPFWAGPRAPLLAERTQDLADFARGERATTRLHTPDEITALPYHLACATWLADYTAVLGELRKRDDFCARSTAVRFEDFLSDREATLQRLGAFMGIRDAVYPPNRLYYRPIEGEGGIRTNQDAGAEGRGTISPVFDARQREQVLQVLGPARQALGYGADADGDQR